MFPVVEDKLLPVLILCTIIYVSVSYLQSRRTTKKDSNQTKAATTLLPKSKTTTEPSKPAITLRRPPASSNIWIVEDNRSTVATQQFFA